MPLTPPYDPDMISDMKTYIIYIHGFASVGESPKTAALREEFPNAVVYAPTLPFAPNDTIVGLRAKIKELINTGAANKIILMGTSLGGFYARILSGMMDIPAILINPLVFVKNSGIRAGRYTNYTTGVDFEVSGEQVNQLVQMDKDAEMLDMVNAYYFANRDDDIIPYQKPDGTFKHAAGYNIYDTGGHRFTDIRRTFPTLHTLMGDNAA